MAPVPAGRFCGYTFFGAVLIEIRLIAIMLGRLEMDVDECIQAYTTLSGTIFSKRESKFSIGLNGNIKAKFSSKRLREAIESIMNERGVPPDEAFDDGETDKSRGCRVLVDSLTITSRSEGMLTL